MVDRLTKREMAALAGLQGALAPLQSLISLPQLLALMAIASNEGLSVNELAEKLCIPQQTASRHVSALLGRYQLSDQPDQQMAPLIKQEINSDDPRRRALFLSEDGLVLVQTLASNENNKTTKLSGGEK